MTALSVRFARALAQGRRIKPAPPTRTELLATLLRKRAAAAAAEDTELEAMLRAQIQWALPVEKGEAVSTQCQEASNIPGGSPP